MRRCAFVSLAILMALWTGSAGAAERPAGAGMNLRDAVSYALEHSPALKASQAEVERRQGAVTTARSFLMPQLDLSADAARTRFERGYPMGVISSELRFDTVQYSAGADLKSLVWDFQKTALELAAARDRVAAAGLAVDRARQEIVFETARLYLQTLAYTDLIDAAQERTISLRSLWERTNKLVQGGRAVPIDSLKIQTKLAQVESDLATLQSGRRTSLAALAAVMGFEGDLPQLAYTPASPDRLFPAADESQLLRQAETGRPELRSQDHEINAFEQAEQAARKSALPRIDFRATAIQYASNNPTGVSTNAPAPGNAVTDWVVGLHVSFPLFDGGRRKGQIHSAQAQLEGARLARQQLGFRIEREVRTAMADLESAESRVRSFRNTVAESEQVLHDERLKFEAGRSVINFVLDAEAALLTNQSLLSQAQRSVTAAALALDLALGRIEVNRLPD